MAWRTHSLFRTVQEAPTSGFDETNGLKDAGKIRYYLNSIKSTIHMWQRVCMRVCGWGCVSLWGSVLSGLTTALRVTSMGFLHYWHLKAIACYLYLYDSQMTVDLMLKTVYRFYSIIYIG